MRFGPAAHCSCYSQSWACFFAVVIGNHLARRAMVKEQSTQVSLQVFPAYASLSAEAGNEIKYALDFVTIWFTAQEHFQRK